MLALLFGMSGNRALSRWQETGGKARAVTLLNRATSHQGCRDDLDLDGAGGMPRRSVGTFVGLFVLLVTVWSAILLSAIFSLRINKDGCENCPEGCTCRGAPPAWG